MDVSGLASGIARRVVNPFGRPSEAELRDAVAGRVVLVTGASHGIGRETALALARAGATVVGVARSADVLDELADECGLEPRPCDLSDPQAAAALGAQVLADHGHVDVVVSNAGKSIRRSFARSADRFHDVERTIAVNYLGPVRLLMEVLPAMRARGIGHVVNVSTAGLHLPPAPGWSVYLGSKAAFDTWLRCVAAETEADGITATSVYLGLVHTRMSAPTDFSGVPGLSARRAADVVCDAIVRQPSAITPWWATAASVFGDVARGPSEALVRRVVRGGRVGS